MKIAHVRAIVAGVAVSVLSTPASAQFGFLNSLTKGAGQNTGQVESRTAVKEAAAEYAARHEDWARPVAEALYADGEWGAVLNFQRLGLAAMKRQKFDLARRALDEAITRVEAIYADDENARKARSVFNAESVKDFKGEPYERAMLYYYRGLLYVQEGDYQNARAAFLAADRHITLSSAESETFASDFGLLKYLAGWASACENDVVRAEHLVMEARAADPKVGGLPALPPRRLLLVEAGPAPIKWGDGQYKHILKFKPGESVDVPFKVRVDGGQVLDQMSLAGDLVHQATTRGGREVDGIMAGKANFKETAGQVGNVGVNVGMQAALMGGMSGNRDLAGAGLAGMFVGLIAKGIEAASNPAADVRAWETLPARIYLAEDPGRGRPELLMGDKPQPMDLVVEHGRCALAWAPTSAMNQARVPQEVSANTESGRGNRNKAFREMLRANFATAN